MQGAREYADLFKTGQYGKLYIESGCHARGKTFKMWVLKDATVIGSEYPLNYHNSPDSVEVYGIIGGQAGWTEYYGWLHKGKWVEDFQNMVKKRKSEIEAAAFKKAFEIQAVADEKLTKQLVVLDNY